MNETSVEIGRTLRGRYVLEERLGTGARGTVFRAVDSFRADLPEENRYVAIKILHPGAENRAQRLAGLKREFYCAQVLSHESIVNVYEMDRDGDLEFFTMEFLEGELLSSVLSGLHPGTMSRPQAWTIIREIGAALQHAHARNVVHADLRPHNILLTHAGEIRILDFGAAGGAAEVRGTDPIDARATAASAYACCELLAGRSPDPRDDLYALACIAYELLAGTHPFQRRPATDARDLGILPKRPPGLTRQQWQALKVGLSWHRAGRSMSIRAWMSRLNADRVPGQRLPGVRDVRPSPPVRHAAASSLRATTLFVVLVLTIGTWVSFVRLAAGSRSTENDVASTATIPTGPAADSLEPAGAAGTAGAAGEAASPADGGKRGAELAGATPALLPAPTDGHSRVEPGRTNDAGRSRSPPAAAPAGSVPARYYTVSLEEHFAEIRIHRSPRLRGDAEFMWWTEAASAKPGIDYVHQGKVRQSFPKGRTSTSFFIKLVPRASRARREVFYVAIAEVGHGASSDPVERAAIWLPTNQDRSLAAVERDSPSDPRVSTAALGSSPKDQKQ